MTVGELLKICGATTEDDVALLADAGVDFVGIWHGVPGGRAELPLPAAAALAEVARSAPRLCPVLVTFLSDPARIRAVMERTGVRWVQLHGYQPPGLVRALKDGAPEPLTVVKVLHVRGGKCVEGPLLPSYERAGTDLFLLDSTSEDGQVGSTGQAIDASAAMALAERMTRPFLLAGGIAADNRDAYREVAAHPRFRGVDVDTAARGADGRFDVERVRALRRTWGGET